MIVEEIEQILSEPYALTEDEETLYADNGNVYRVCLDYHDGTIIDLVLISQYTK